MFNLCTMILLSVVDRVRMLLVDLLFLDKAIQKNIFNSLVVCPILS